MENLSSKNILFLLLFLAISNFCYSQSYVHYNHDTGTIELTVFYNGLIGDDGTGWGDGFTFSGYANALYAGGIMIGTPQNGVNGKISVFSINDMLNQVRLRDYSNNLNYNQVTNAGFNDEFAPNPLGVDIYQQTFSDDGNDFVYYSYTIANNTGNDIDSIYVGIFADFDVGDYSTNRGGYDQSRNLVYQYNFSGAVDPNYYGIVALSGMSGARVTTLGTSPTIRTEAFEWMTTFLNEPINISGDYRTYIGSGPYSIQAGSVVRIGFALVAGSSLSDLQTNTDAAQSGWNTGNVTMPFIAHYGPDLYWGTITDYYVEADIYDNSGISSSYVHYTVDDGSTLTVNPTSINGNHYTFIIPAQTPGSKIDYWIEANSNLGNNLLSEINFYYAGNILGDQFSSSGFSYPYFGALTSGVAVKLNIPDGYNSDLVAAIITNDLAYQSTVETDSMLIHIWSDNNGFPGSDLITPFNVFIEGYYGTFIDLSPYSSQLSGLSGKFHIGFTLDVQDTIYINGFHPSMYSHTSTFDGNNWTLIDKDHFFYAIMNDFVLAVDDELFLLPSEFVLYQNYPNPFNPATHIRFQLPKASNVKIKVYNTLGQEVAVLLNASKAAGTHTVDFDGSNLSSGVYFYKIQADEFQQVKKMLLMK